MEINKTQKSGEAPSLNRCFQSPASNTTFNISRNLQQENASLHKETKISKVSFCFSPLSKVLIND